MKAGRKTRRPVRGPKITVYEDKKGEFRWHLKAGNGRIIADSGEGYSSKSKANRALDTVFDAFGNCVIEEEGR